MAEKNRKANIITVADIDENGIYQGVKKISEKSLTKKHIQVPEDCDLEPGRYQWNEEQQTFIPLLFIAIKKKLIQEREKLISKGTLNVTS
jgi:hypothetical protein